MTERRRAGADVRLESRSRLVFRARRGRTYLAVADAGAPLKVLRPFDLPDGRALLQIISAAPGLFAGDRYELEIVAEKGARALVITPAAAKIHSMSGAGFARQNVRLRVETEASLEYYPALNIPFPGADVRVRTGCAVAAGGRLGCLELWSTGRRQRGEHLLFRRISARTRMDLDGAPLYRDALELDSRAHGQGLLEGGRYVAAGAWYGPGGPHPEPLENAGAVFGAADDGLIYFRGIFEDSLEMERTVARVRDRAAGLWGLGAVTERRYTG